MMLSMGAILILFLSTLSLRRATRVLECTYNVHVDFYPRSPCGERLTIMLYDTSSLIFLSTLSLRRATESIGTLRTVSVNFYPRSPCGERLHYDNYNLHCVEISIHALLAESDYDTSSLMKCQAKFLSTLSLRRATAKVHKTVGHFCAYETNFMEIASSC